MSPRSPEKTQKQKDASIRERMEASALRILSIRSHTRAELRRKMRQMRFPSSQIEELLGRLESLGYLNDAEAARSWVRRRIRTRPIGRRLMEREIKGLGVSAEIVKEALSEVYEGEAELEHARRAAEKRLKALEGKDKLKERMLRFLKGRGFPAQICLQAAADLVFLHYSPIEEGEPDPSSANYYDS